MNSNNLMRKWLMLPRQFRSNGSIWKIKTLINLPINKMKLLIPVPVDFRIKMLLYKKKLQIVLAINSINNWILIKVHKILGPLCRSNQINIMMCWMNRPDLKEPQQFLEVKIFCKTKETSFHKKIKMVKNWQSKIQLSKNSMLILRTFLVRSIICHKFFRWWRWWWNSPKWKSKWWKFQDS